MRFNKLDVPYQWKEEFTKYPHGYTIFEALCKWVKQVDNMVDNVNDWNDYLDNFVENFEFELQSEVQSTITRWQNEGLLDDIIASALNTELDNVKAQNSHFGLYLGDYQKYVVDGDWGPAIQQALSDFPDTGGTLYLLPQQHIIKSTVIFPHVSSDPLTLKPIVIKGSETEGMRGVTTGWSSGQTSLYYTGDGIMFDFRNGNNDKTNSRNVFKNIKIYGKGLTENQICFNMHSFKGGMFENVAIIGFNKGIVISKHLYYSKFYNVDLSHNYDGLTLGLVNGTTISKCNFSSNEHDGVVLNYSGAPVNFDGCWFENNTYGLRVTNTIQVNLTGCYFENNSGANVRMSHYENTENAQLNLFNCMLSIPDDAERCIYLVGSDGGGYVSCNLINTHIQADSFDKHVVNMYGSAEVNAINTRYNNKYVKITHPQYLKLDINNQYRKHNYFGKSLRLKTNTSLQFGEEDTVTYGDIDFPEIASSSGTLRLFRNTNTTGDLGITVYKGTGTSIAVRLDAKTGKVLAYGGIGVGNSVNATSPGNVIKKMEVFDQFGNSIGFVPIYDNIT